jgi:membrane-bound lytic murein transglycosylase B
MIRLIAACVALTLAWSAGAQAPQTYASRPEVRAFIAELVARHGFVERELNLVFSRAQRQDVVLKAIERPPEQTLSWEEYRAGFLTDRRIQAGLEFWNSHGAALARAAREYGVPEDLIVAILGVETFYGRRMGRWRVIDALATLAFDYPPRAAFFRTELEHYLLLVRDAGLDVFGVKGSYAGAMGMPQFMPRSYVAYAVDFDRDGAVDLSANPTDAIGSVANFLKRHGWHAGEAVQAGTTVNGLDFLRYADGSVEPRHSLAELTKAGVSVRGDLGLLPQDARASLVELASTKRPSEYRLGFHNFWVLTRYNRSILYGSAVVDLAAALSAARRQGLPG